MPNTSGQVVTNRRMDFPFPLFLYAVVFLLSGLLNTFQSASSFYGGWIYVPPTLWGLVNLYLLAFVYNWISILVSVSGVINIVSAVLVFARVKYCRRVAQANLGFSIVVGIIGFVSSVNVYRGEFLFSEFSPGLLGFVLFLGVNGGWFYYFQKYDLLP